MRSSGSLVWRDLPQPLVRAALPWLRTSDYWLSRRAPSVHRSARSACCGRCCRRWRRRAANWCGGCSAWSAVIVEDEGWRYESRGGWAEPALDDAAPLRMTDAAVLLKPAVRMYWSAPRAQRSVLEAGRTARRTGGVGVQRIRRGGSVGDGDGAGRRLPADDEGDARRQPRYREEFNAGIGDEVAFVMDMQARCLLCRAFPKRRWRGATPRFIVARPVVDRANIDASGASFAASWKGLTGWASELSGSELPLIVPQKIDSIDLVTLEFAAAIHRWRFHPGVTMSDSCGCRDLQVDGSGLSKAMVAPSSAGEARMIVEIDFAPIRDGGGVRSAERDEGGRVGRGLAGSDEGQPRRTWKRGPRASATAGSEPPERAGRRQAGDQPCTCGSRGPSSRPIGRNLRSTSRPAQGL